MVDEKKTMNPLGLPKRNSLRGTPQRLASKKELPKKNSPCDESACFRPNTFQNKKKQEKPEGIPRCLDIVRSHGNCSKTTLPGGKPYSPKKKKKKNMLPFGGRCLKTRSLGGYPEPSQFSWFSEKWNVFNRIVTPFIFAEPWKFGKRVPSWQLTYPHSRYIWVDDLPFERWDMLVPWEGTPLTALSTLYTPEV